MMGCKRSNLLRPRDKERGGSDEHCVDLLLTHSCKGCVDLAFGVGG
jgi:hypothetical protein